MKSFRPLVSIALLLWASQGHTASLLDVYQTAIENDSLTKAAYANTQAVQAIRTQQRAGLLPTLNFDASISRNREDRIQSEASFLAPGNTTIDNTSYSLTLNQPLYNGQTLASVKQAGLQSRQAQVEYSIAEQALILRVAEQYFNILSAMDSLEFAQREKSAIARQLEQTKQRFEVGLIAITDVHESQAAYDLTTALEIEAENTLANQKESLWEITHQYPESFATLDNDMPLISPNPADINTWRDNALQSNRQIIAQTLNMKAVTAALKQQRAGHHPTLNAQARYAYSDTAGGSFGQETTDTSIGLALNVPLYQGGATQAGIKEAQYRLDASKNNLENTRRVVQRQTVSAYLGTESDIKRVEALSQAVISAQSALKATEAGLTVGTRTTVDVLAARKELFRAKRNDARARYNYIINTLRLKNAVGSLNIDDLKQIDRWLK